VNILRDISYSVFCLVKTFFSLCSIVGGEYAPERKSKPYDIIHFFLILCVCDVRYGEWWGKRTDLTYVK
jgi:hypothetical protein